MQAVIKRAEFAKNQARRRGWKGLEKRKRDKIRSNQEQNAHINRQAAQALRIASANRRNDYELGPLAAKHDVGDFKDTYGTIHSSRVKGNYSRVGERSRALKEFGGWWHMNIVKNDRVVLIEGRDKGKIGKIVEVDRERVECTVEGLNLIDVAIPDYMIDDEDPDKRPVRTLPKPVPLSDVRLVYPLEDPETGITRDVIIKKLVNGPIYRNRHTKGTKWSRIVPGLNIAIPWPKVQPTEHKDGPMDTLRTEVEEKTFIPSLLRPPMPNSVIDELRNKFSKFRTRHDPEYVEKKMAEDREAEERKRSVSTMRTPLKEINRKERKLRRAKGKGKLTAEMMQKIGEIIAKKRGLENTEPHLVAA